MVESRFVEKNKFFRWVCRAGLAVALFPAPVRAWGPVGHRMIAETAALLVQRDLPNGWGPLLARHRFELGVYAYLPDVVFRHIDRNGGKTEAPTHYLNLDAPPDAPAGSVDRRVVQFMDLAASQLSEVHAPRGGYVRGATAVGDVRHIYDGLFDLGVMAHYSGDAAMPYHATADSNGFSQGEGGIHFYFEDACVEVFEPGLAIDVLSSARRHGTRWLQSWGVPKATPRELVVAVLKDSLAAVSEVSELDKAKAILKLATKGSTADATRKPAKQGCAAMRSLLVERLAKGAVLTTFLWEHALPKNVDFSGAAALKFSDMELAPEYVPPLK